MGVDRCGPHGRVPHRHPVNGYFLPEVWRGERELPSQKGIFSPLPASSWPYSVNLGGQDRQVKGRRGGFLEGRTPPSLPRSAGEGSLQTSLGNVESSFGLLNLMRIGRTAVCLYNGPDVVPSLGQAGGTRVP